MTEGEPRYRWHRRRAVGVWFSALAHIRLCIYFFSTQEKGGLHGSRGELLETRLEASILPIMRGQTEPRARPVATSTPFGATLMRGTIGGK